MRCVFYFDNPHNATNPLQQVRLHDGTAWGIETIKALLLAGNEQAQTLIGYPNNGTISGLIGDDTLDARTIGSLDQFTGSNWYRGNQHHVEQFNTSDGKTLLDSHVQNLVGTMATFEQPAYWQSTLQTHYATGLQPIFAAHWL